MKMSLPDKSDILTRRIRNNIPLNNFGNATVQNLVRMYQQDTRYIRMILVCLEIYPAGTPCNNHYQVGTKVAYFVPVEWGGVLPFCGKLMRFIIF